MLNQIASASPRTKQKLKQSPLLIKRQTSMMTSLPTETQTESESGKTTPKQTPMAIETTMLMTT